ncbi:MAG: septum formation inhibitor Maf [Candidatus Tectomicrobia bacterium]|uniref:dTTP/UTP pyrophosphatase n=1 Tax=Tectimicrobiota bacterium TaxID=2528274 RepID=A0A933GP43_UNCTE|nr:septum formation inhibitor Maf [Candidatus Tectomicrobia bacterium]
MTKHETPLILASNSPRRAALLKQIGLHFKIIPPKVEESRKAGESAVKYVRRLAALKAEAVAVSHQKGLVISADTVVLLGEEILEKPANEEEARTMLYKLRGKQHRVITGLALVRKDPPFSRVSSVVTTVEFRELSSRDIEGYLATGEPFDKAGAYGIQGRGAALVKTIKGCYFNVVGLPLSSLAELLAEANCPIW